jgi:hypothetical protein
MLLFDVVALESLKDQSKDKSICGKTKIAKKE